MNLKTRLGLAFAAMLLLTVAVGGFSLHRIYLVNQASQEITGHWLPTIRLVTKTRTTLDSVRRLESDHVLNNNQAALSSIDESLKTEKAAIEQLERELAPLMNEPAERTIEAEFKKRLHEYFAVQEEMLTTSRNGEKGDSYMLYRGQSSQLFATTQALLQKLGDMTSKGSEASHAAAERIYNAAIVWLLALIGVAVVLAAGLALWLVRGVIGQLGGEPADATNLARRVASGDLSVPIRLRGDDSTSLMAALKRMQDSLSQIVTTVRGNAEGVATASSQISQGTTDLSSRTEQQASALEETAASMKELAGTVNQNANNAQDGNRLANEASEVATRGGEVVSRVVDTMKGINESSRKIADIITVIDGIAFQTNILALNAAVEAARAGEQGRGFAVVASEVRSLAQRSAEAAKEIKALITDSVDRVGQGSELVDQAGATMNEVVASIQRVAQITSGISTASLEQSAGVAQIGEAVTQMDQATQQNAALVEQSAAAADSLRQQAQQLLDAVSVFKVNGAMALRAAPVAVAPVTANPVRTPAPAPAPKRPETVAPRSPATVTTAEDDWSSF